MKKLLNIFLFSLIVGNLYCTTQISDRLIYKGDTVMISSTPLEVYFENNTRPNEVFKKYGNNLTSCNRGYIGYWELKNDSLYLVRLEGFNSDIDLSLIFKNRVGIVKIYAEWFSGSLFNPYGNKIAQLHSDVGSIYEDELEFVFVKGVLDEIKEHDNSKSRKSEYTKDSELLRKYMRKNINYSTIGNNLEAKITVHVKIITVTENGIIDSVSVFRGYNNEVDAEALRVVKSIPEWDVLYNHGEQIQIPYIVPVIFDKVKK